MNSGHSYQARLRQGHWFNALPAALQEALLAAAQASADCQLHSLATIQVH